MQRVCKPCREDDVLKGHPELQSWSLEELIYNADTLPETIRQSVINNGDGVYNQIFYFDGMTNSESRSKAGALYSALLRDFGYIEDFYEYFKNQALSVFGSGYAWLVSDQDGKLSIITLANQNTPIAQNLCPIAAIDVWEHTYYLKHYNERAAYINDWFNVANWELADQRYQQGARTE